MIKICEITLEQLDKFYKSKNKKKVFKDILGLNTEEKYEIGDTAISVDNPKELEIYENKWGDRTHYYIIIKVINSKLAMTYSLYPIN